MPYIYETHLHTCVASACGKSHGYEYIDYYKSKGYAGIIVTDHFFNGNCAIPRDLPWNEMIDRFYAGYEEAKKEGDKKNLQVFFAWECNFEGDEYLVYGLDKQWLLDHPDILSWDHITHLNKVHEAGGIVVQAHPFRERGYLSRVNLHPLQSDAWEVANAGNEPYQDQLAYKYALQHNIPMTSGSDIHIVDASNITPTFGVIFDTPLTSIKDYADRIKSGKGFTNNVPLDRLKMENEVTAKLPIYLYDKNNHDSKVTLNELFQ